MTTHQGIAALDKELHALSQWGTERLRHNPEAHGLPAYPKGDVVGPCVCGSWPGGKCLQCAVIPATGEQA